MITTYIALLLTIFVAHDLWKRRDKSKKAYFKRNARDLELQIWDNEFERFKTKEAREELRVDYDRKKAQLETLRTTMKINDEKSDADPTKLNADDRKRLNDEQGKLELDIKHMSEGRAEGDPLNDGLSLSNLDNTIAIYNNKIDRLHSLRAMTLDYIKKSV